MTRKKDGFLCAVKKLSFRVLDEASALFQKIPTCLACKIIHIDLHCHCLNDPKSFNDQPSLYLLQLCFKMGIASRKEREKQERRQSILKSATEVFFEKGFEKSSMEMIAERSQLAKGTLYLYFKSKEDLYMALMKDGLHILHSMFDQVIKKNMPIEQKFRDIAKAYIRFTQAYEDYAQVMMMVDSGQLSDKVDQAQLEQIRALQMHGIEKLQKVVEDGISQGYYDKSVDAKNTVLMSWAAIWGAVMLSSEKRRILPMFNGVDVEQFALEVAERISQSFQAKNAL